MEHGRTRGGAERMIIGTEGRAVRRMNGSEAYIKGRRDPTSSSLTFPPMTAERRIPAFAAAT